MSELCFHRNGEECHSWRNFFPRLVHRVLSALQQYAHELRDGIARHFHYSEAERDLLCLSHIEPQIHAPEDCPLRVIGYCLDCAATRLLTRSGCCNACGSASVDGRRFVR